MLSPPWLAAHPPMADPTRFLVVGMQRSGTTVTLAELHRHPAVAVAADEVRLVYRRGESRVEVRLEVMDGALADGEGGWLELGPGDTAQR